MPAIQDFIEQFTYLGLFAALLASSLDWHVVRRVLTPERSATLKDG